KNPNERYSRAGEMAKDLRNLRSQAGRGAAGAGAHEAAKLVPADARKGANASAPTASFPRAAPAAPASPSGPGSPAPDFLAGLDAFSRKVDEEQRAHERADAEQRRRREEEEAGRKGGAGGARQRQAKRRSYVG